MDTEGTATSFGEMIDALGHVQRRKLLMALLTHNPQDDSPVVVTESDSDREAIERLVAMKHVHLPKLVEYGFIDWDQEEHEVRTGPRFAEIRPLLELLEHHEDELPADWL